MRTNLLLLALKCTLSVASSPCNFENTSSPTTVSSSQSYLLFQHCTPQTSHLRHIFFNQYLLAMKSKLFVLFLVERISLLSCSYLLSQYVFFLIFSHACQSLCLIPDDSLSLPLSSLSNLSTLSLGSFLQLLFMGSFLSYPFSPFRQGSHSPAHTELHRNLLPSFSASNSGLVQENWWRCLSHDIQNSGSCKSFVSFLSLFPLCCQHCLFFDAAGS